MHSYIMALDQGTTSSRAIIFNENGQITAVGQKSFRQIYPQPGWVEHDPADILSSQYQAMVQAIQIAGISPKELSGIGITNQRETTIIWERSTGKPIYNAIVWQCRRTASICEELKTNGTADLIVQRTGLLPDAYFSGTKILWLLDHIPEARKKAENGELMFGTVDSWLIYNLTGNHLTDYSNACRTMLFNIETLTWDSDICRLLKIPLSILPVPVPNAWDFGAINSSDSRIEAFNGVPILGSIGDQQSALLGQGCLHPGESKNTYGTGCFTLMNCGSKPVRCSGGLLTDIAWSINGNTQYALEGSIFNAGSSIQWLRDELGLITSAHECDILAESVADTGGVYMVSAFTGLGAPYWDMYARGTLCGITRGTTKAHIARAVLEGIAYQVKDMLESMEEASGIRLSALKVDGGASVSDFLMQFQSNILNCEINRPAMIETTALGAAFLAGYHGRIWTSTDELLNLRKTEHIFYPELEQEKIDLMYSGWKKAVSRSLNWAK